MAMPMAAMHEEVHQRACQEHQEGKGTKGVRCVLQQQVKGRHKQKAIEHPPGPATWRPAGEEGGISHRIS
jgi:hypothetical protein